MGELLLCRALLIVSFAILTLTLSLRIFFVKVVFFTLLGFLRERLSRLGRSTTSISRQKGQLIDCWRVT